MSLATGFVGPVVGGTWLTARQRSVCGVPNSRLAFSARPARFSPRMTAVQSEDEESDSQGTVPFSAQEVLSSMRSTVAKDDGPRSINTGVTRDADGKSNVWAVEPSIQVDDKPEMNKLAILGAVFAAVALALFVLPRLPFVTPDQF